MYLYFLSDSNDKKYKTVRNSDGFAVIKK